MQLIVSENRVSNRNQKKRIIRTKKGQIQGAGFTLFLKSLSHYHFLQPAGTSKRNVKCDRVWILPSQFVFYTGSDGGKQKLRPTKKKSRLSFVKTGSLLAVGGGSRIRTYGGFTLDSRKDHCFQPLSHPSVSSCHYHILFVLLNLILNLEREAGFEPTASILARSLSTNKLLSLNLMSNQGKTKTMAVQN